VNMDVAYTDIRNEQDWQAVTKHIPVLRVQDTQGVLAWVKEELVGAVILDSWNHSGVSAHFLLRKPFLLRHGFLERCLNFIFNVRKKKYIYAQVASNNEKALKLDKHLGFVEVARMVDGYDDGIDYILMELAKENCRHLKGDSNV